MPNGDRLLQLASGMALYSFHESNGGALWPSVEAFEANWKEAFENEPSWDRAEADRSYADRFGELRSRAVTEMRMGDWSGSDKDIDRLQARLLRRGYDAFQSGERFTLFYTLVLDAMLNRLDGVLCMRRPRGESDWVAWVDVASSRQSFSPLTMLFQWLEEGPPHERLLSLFEDMCRSGVSTKRLSLSSEEVHPSDHGK